MTDCYQAIRELARRAVQACDGDWHAAEQLVHRWLAQDPATKQRIMEGLLEFHIRHAITAEARRQHQREADRRRDAIVAHEQAQETAHLLEELLRDLEEADGGRHGREERE